MSSDRTYLLFAREAGMIYASAKSVREERSKQRYALQACSHIRATLIRGKTGWKIAGVEPIHNLYSITETREARALLRNVIVLLRRVVRGETAYESIFDDVVRVCMLGEQYAHTKLESILSFRILHALGYVAPVDRFTVLLEKSLPLHHIDIFSDEDEEVCREIIEHALIQSQL